MRRAWGRLFSVAQCRKGEDILPPLTTEVRICSGRHLSPAPEWNSSILSLNTEKYLSFSDCNFQSVR